jgi:hypothetical protein
MLGYTVFFSISLFWDFWPLLNAALGRGKLCGRKSSLRFVEIPATINSAEILVLGFVLTWRFYVSLHCIGLDQNIH